ncbi:MAG: (Fe-S)-binding protein [Candidatus Thiodiazotropha sp.]
MKTYLDWSEYTDAGMGDAYADIPKTGGDFAKAVAVCINSRQCETEAKGVMCPSFRISQDPSLSTGARVRLLKEALNGNLGRAGISEPNLIQAMDLCVSCKGCKRECENNVDMARIKIEYLAQLNAQTGLSLRARLFAGLPGFAATSAWFRRLTAWRNRHRLLAQLAERLLGISAQVKLPEVVSEPIAVSDWVAEDRQVILFVDTFSRHYSPQIAHAAIEVLEVAGYQVRLAVPEDEAANERPLCCGRTYLAQGMVDQAREEARRVIDALLPYAEAGLPIVGLEPSCLLTLRDEYAALGLGEAANLVAKQALLFEEFLAREMTAGRFDLPMQPATDSVTRVLVHGHCHQKAVGAMKSMRKVLKRIPGLSFEMIDASCCGMAGSFGIEAEHVDYAREMANQALVPALQAEPAAGVVANGFSCRQQISHTAERDSMHLAQLLQSRLAVRAC